MLAPISSHILNIDYRLRLWPLWGRASPKGTLTKYLFRRTRVHIRYYIYTHNHVIIYLNIYIYVYIYTHVRVYMGMSYVDTCIWSKNCSHHSWWCPGMQRRLPKEKERPLTLLGYSPAVEVCSSDFGPKLIWQKARLNESRLGMQNYIQWGLMRK